MTFELQWGHGDEAVEEVAHQTGTARGAELQWGHGDEAVEEVDDAERLHASSGCFNGATAMKPWKSLADPVDDDRVVIASMGPRR